MVSPEGAMRGMLEHLAPLREQIVKCEQSRSKVHRQAVFERIAAHHRVAAAELDHAISLAE